MTSFRLRYFVLVFLSSQLLAQEGRLLRFPDIRDDKIAFVYAGDIWLVSSAGGSARRLTSHEGQELFPKFSPDGKWIAFSAEYSGSRQVYVMPSEGGTPRQLTYYNDVGQMPPRGGYDYQVLGWTPDSKRVLFRGNRLPWTERLGRYYTIGLDGGLEQPLPIPEGGTGELSPDGKKMVYTPIEREWRTWKRTRGGRAQDVWIFDLQTLSAERITDHPMTDDMPMWIGDAIFFTSDREHTLNIYRYDLATKRVEKMTHHEDYDVLWPSSGPGAIVYQCGGWLYVFDVATRTSRKVPIDVETDAPPAFPAFRSVSSNISSFSLSPSGVRALFEARGEIFTVPAKYGPTRNLSRSPATRELYPTWARDGSRIAFLSDRSGEYELYTMDADGGNVRQVTKGDTTWMFPPAWSPDGSMIAFADKRHRLRIVHLGTGRVVEVARSVRDDITSYEWSPDSRWIAYVDVMPNGLYGMYLSSVDNGATTLLSSGKSNDFNPVFTSDGGYIAFISNRDFNLTFSDYEFTYVYTNAARIFAAPLRASLPPIAPYRSDEERGETTRGSDSGKDKAAPADAAAPIRIDTGGFASRVTAIDVPSANYGSLRAAPGCLLYIRSAKGERNLYRYGIEKQKEELVLANVAAYDLSADGKKIIYRSGGKYGICDNAGDQKPGEGTLDLSRMEMKIDPRREWAQIFDDAWRLMRDWFYDPNMHGVDWRLMRHRYGQLVPFVAERSDLDFVIGELIGELNSGHTYVERGDERRVPRRDGGLLGCEFSSGIGTYYRIDKIFHGENWDEAFRSPLTEPGMIVHEGEYLISIDGNEVTTADNPYRFLENTAGRAIPVRVNDRPSADGAREVVVVPVKSELNLRFSDWVERNRRWVDSTSGGRIGYIWIPNTAAEGNRELFKWFYPQARKDALIIDDRYNGGGYIPYNMIDLLGREPLNYWARRGIEPFSAPDVFHAGPKACLINGYSSSGGDAFPYYFRKRKLGPLIGTRTWGGLIGLSGNPDFIDGGSIEIPTFRFYDTEGHWAIENEGVAPDIEVVDRPDLVARGHDPSLEKAVQVLLDTLKMSPPARPAPPVPPDESK